MTIFVFGANSPISIEYARQHAKADRAINRDRTICLGARNVEDASKVAQDLQARYGVQAEAFRFDATDTESHASLILDLEEKFGPASAALLAFGDMGVPLGTENEDTEIQRVIDTNYTAVVTLSETLSAQMSRRGFGVITLLSSVAGERGRQSNYLYGSAKGAAALYAQGLRNRMFKAGVHVLTVKLGFVDTRLTFGLQTKIPIAAPTSVAQALIRAEQKRINVLFYPRFWQMIMLIIRLIPEFIFKRLSL